MNGLLRVCLIVGVLFGVAAIAQQNQPSDPFEAVPAEKREQLRADMNQALELQKHGRWKEFDAIYDKDFPGTKYRPPGIKELSKTPRLIEFVPTKVRWNDQQQAWMFDGCASFDEPHTSSGGGGYVAGMTVRYVDRMTKDGFQRCNATRR